MAPSAVRSALVVLAMGTTLAAIVLLVYPAAQPLQITDTSAVYVEVMLGVRTEFEGGGGAAAAAGIHVELPGHFPRDYHVFEFVAPRAKSTPAPPIPTNSTTNTETPTTPAPRVPKRVFLQHVSNTTSKPYRLSVFTMLQDKAAFVVEWLVFHLLQGVEHFYIVDDRSRDRAELERVLMPYIVAGVVELVPSELLNPNHLRYRNFSLFELVFPYYNISDYSKHRIFNRLEKRCVDQESLGHRLTRNLSEPLIQFASNADCQKAIMRHYYMIAKFRKDEWVGHFDVDEFLFQSKERQGTLITYLLSLNASVSAVNIEPLPFGPVNNETLSKTMIGAVRPMIGQPTINGRMDLLIDLARDSVMLAMKPPPPNKKPWAKPPPPQYYIAEPTGHSQELKNLSREDRDHLYKGCHIPIGQQPKSFYRPDAVDFAAATIHCGKVRRGSFETVQGFLVHDSPVLFFHYQYFSLAMSFAKASARRSISIERAHCYPWMHLAYVQDYLTLQRNNTQAADFAPLVRHCALPYNNPAVLRDPQCSITITAGA